MAGAMSAEMSIVAAGQRQMTDLVAKVEADYEAEQGGDQSLT